jgi:hypothetical protein
MELARDEFKAVTYVKLIEFVLRLFSLVAPCVGSVYKSTYPIYFSLGFF